MSAWKTDWRRGRPGWLCLGDHPEKCAFWTDDKAAMNAHWDSGAHRKPDPWEETSAWLGRELAALRREAWAEMAGRARRELRARALDERDNGREESARCFEEAARMALLALDDMRRGKP